MSYPFVPALSTASFGLLLALLLSYRPARANLSRWLAAVYLTGALSGILVTMLGTTPEALPLAHLATYAWALNAICIVFLSLTYAGASRRNTMFILAAAWLVTLIAVDWLAAGNLIWPASSDGLMRIPPLDVGGVVFIASWLALAIVTIIRTLIAAARAPLPLYANRLIFWAIALALTFAGQFMSVFYERTVALPGFVLQLVGFSALLYGVISYHVVDVRNLARRVLGFVVSTLITSLLVLAAIQVAALFITRLSAEQAFSLSIMVAVVLGAFFQIVYPALNRFINRHVSRTGHDPARIVETYSRTIGSILALDSLSTAAIDTINRFVGIRRGGLILVTRENEHAVLQPAAGLPPQPPMDFPVDGPVLEHFSRTQSPLTQYDIDVLPAFRNLSPEKREWLCALQVDVFLPIATEGLPIGLLAVGSKKSGEPFRPAELQLLQALAGQTIVALANARLFDDLSRLNAEIQALNLDLQHSNDRLQYLDQVKTDFITIASHELRTPLTQVRGYADILDALNDEGLLTKEEAAKYIAAVATAATQLENVINAMLDVSQIDVDAMALTMSEVDLELVLRTAIQPRVQAMRERKQTLTIHGVRDLPHINGDYQRLVQAIGNLISNAIKYTPDGGHVTIKADVLRDEADQVSEVELVISDTGVGIDPRDLDLIFEKFYRAADPQLHSTGSTKFMGAGPGLGLSIVRGLIEAHGGRIWVESDGYDPIRCPGSSFHIVLPICPPHLNQEAIEALARKELGLEKLVE